MKAGDNGMISYNGVLIINYKHVFNTSKEKPINMYNSISGQPQNNISVNYFDRTLTYSICCYYGDGRLTMNGKLAAGEL